MLGAPQVRRALLTTLRAENGTVTCPGGIRFHVRGARHRECPASALLRCANATLTALRAQCPLVLVWCLGPTHAATELVVPDAPDRWASGWIRALSALEDHIDVFDGNAP